MAGEFTFVMEPKAPKLRPCTVDGVKALFHRWEDFAAVLEPSPMVGGHPGGQVCETYGIVEMEDGQVREVKPSKVVFSDTSERMVIEAASLKEVLSAKGAGNVRTQEQSKRR